MKHILQILPILAAQITYGEELIHEVACADASGTGNEVEKHEVVSDSGGKPYFPKGRESYYTAYYRAANLPSLQSLRPDKSEVFFRVAVFPSFSKPIFLTYSRDQDGGLIHVARLSGRLLAGGKPGTVELQGSVRINKEVAGQFEEAAALPEVRNPLASLDDRLLPLFYCLDGVRWILEVVTSEGYTMVDVQNPESFEYHENEVRAYFDKDVRADPAKYKLPDSFKGYKLPDLNVSVFAIFCEDLLRIAEVGVPQSKGDERLSFRIR